MVLPLPAVQTSGHMKDAARVLFEASCGARFQGALVLVPLPQEDMKGLGHTSPLWFRTQDAQPQGAWFVPVLVTSGELMAPRKPWPSPRSPLLPS